jgi:hypothetical protein
VLSVVVAVEQAVINWTATIEDLRERTSATGSQGRNGRFGREPEGHGDWWSEASGLLVGPRRDRQG